MMGLKSAIFKYYGSWHLLAEDLSSLAYFSGTTPNDISDYIQGFNNGLSIKARIRICEYLGLNPEDYPEIGRYWQ